MSRVFLTYSQNDADLMARLRGGLLEGGFQVVFDTSEERPGTPAWEAAVEGMLAQADAMAVILTPDAIESARVLNLLNLAEARGQGIFPVLMRGDEREVIPLGMEALHRYDLRTDYDAGLEELLMALAGHLGEPLAAHTGTPPAPPLPPRVISGRGVGYVLGLFAAGLVLVAIGVASILLLAGVIDLPGSGNHVQGSPAGTPTATLSVQAFTPTAPPVTTAPTTPTGLPSEFTVCPSGCAYDQLGLAIAAAPPGTTIELGPGTLTEHVVIDKSLTLRGQGRDSTRIEARESLPVLTIASPDEIAVTLQGLTVDGGSAPAGDVGCIPAPQDCQNGIVALGSAVVTLDDVAITGNADTGLWARSDAEVNVNNADISGNHVAGVALGDTAKAVLANVNLTNNGGEHVLSAGVRANDFGELTLSGVTVTDNAWSGVWVGEGTTVDIRDSTIRGTTGGSDAFGAGLVVSGESQVTVQNTLFEGNGTNALCLGQDSGAQVCSGILTVGRAFLTLIDSTIQGSPDWGLSAQMIECGFDQNAFFGQVTFLGDTTIEGNDLSLANEEAGNPGPTPWNGTEPQGQVCLPLAPSDVGPFCGDGICQEWADEVCSACVADCGVCPIMDIRRFEVYNCVYRGGGVFEWYTANVTYEYGQPVKEDILSGPHLGPWQPGCPAER